MIDLQKNALVFNSANIETKFLPESELPGFARPNNEHEMDITTTVSDDSKKTPQTSKHFR